MAEILTAAAIAARIFDGAAVAVSGNGGGIVEPDDLMAAVEHRFLTTGHPRDLTFIHAFGIGDRAARGSNRFAHEGLVKRVIAGHYTWSHTMQDLVRNNAVEAYCFPSGVIQQLLREIGAGRPGLITHVGLDAFPDPRHEGGKCNARTRDDLVEIVRLDGQEYLRYKPFKLDFALIRGTLADPRGNLSLEEEPLELDVRSLAIAAHNCGGRVFAQVRTVAAPFTLNPRLVTVPGILIDGLFIDPEQRQTYLGGDYDNSLSGKYRVPAADEAFPLPTDPVRLLIARRAAQELTPGISVNFGFGIPGAIPTVARRAGIDLDSVWMSMEQGVHNGLLQDGQIFGSSRNPEAVIPSVDQFDFFSGGGLDLTFLGFGEADAHGDVNVSRLSGRLIGPGGFMDISARAKKAIFCGTFQARGARVSVDAAGVHVHASGEINKFVRRVQQITFSHARQLAQRQEAMIITERAVFRLTADGVELTELAPGIDLERDVLAAMDFRPQMPRPPRLTALTLFAPLPG